MWGRPRHQHRWVETKRAFSGRLNAMEATRISADEMERFAFGVTTVELRCTECGDLKHIEHLGDSTS